MGYVPHHAARRLARARSVSQQTSFDQVGLIHIAMGREHLDPVCLAMMEGAEYELSKLHASLTFLRVGESEDWDKVERLSRAGGLDGWLIYGPPSDEIANRLRSTKLPFVVLGDHRCTQPLHCVNVDNFAVGRLAVEHLASRGHRRIAFLGNDMGFVYERETLAGFCAAVRELGLDVDERLIANISLWTGGAAKRLIDWLRNADPMPSAVFASEFEFAPWVQAMLNEAQIHVPQDISVLGYESASFAPKSQYLTRIELPMAEVGRQGALLLHRVATTPYVEFSELKMSPSLIEGGSTRPASDSKIKTTN
jgi:DNA-binding LacI/PurR family transcriptional regulator